MIVKLSHAGIAVKNIDKALEFFTKKLDFTPPRIGIKEYPELHFKNVFLPIGDVFIELLESNDPGSDIGRFLERQGEGLFHICLEVDNIESEIALLKERGVDVIESPPSASVPYKRGFIKRKTANGVLIELCQELRKS